MVYLFDGNGRLTHQTDLATDRVEPIELIKAEHPIYAPLNTKRAFRVEEITTWTDEADERMTFDGILAYAHDAAQAQAASRAASVRELLEDPEAVRRLQEQSTVPDSGTISWARPAVLIACGVLLLCIGLFAWWKRR